jgi:hypothetical protein
MVKIYEFTPHPFELPIERRKKMKCKVWEADYPHPSVVVIEYDFGKDLNDKELQELAEHIVACHQMSVVAVEYAETEVKFSPDLLSRLESYLPNHLKNISQYLSSRHQQLIEQGAFQAVINDLQFNPFVNYPLNEETVIPLYGNENTYTDFGVAAGLDILYGVNTLREIYPDWKWNDCIGLGSGYGAYILQMAEKLCPNTFSMLICHQSLIKPNATALFTNATEFKYGSKKNAYVKYIGKFPLYLNEVQGWTTANGHSFYFEPRHFDLRNLGNSLHLSMGEKRTPLIFVEEVTNDQLHLEEKIAYVEKLIDYNYSVELFIADENDVDNKMIFKRGSDIAIDLKELFDYYLALGYQRNMELNQDKGLNFFPVNGGVYILYNLSGLPKLQFIPSLNEKSNESGMKYLEKLFNNNRELYELLNNYDNIDKILFYIENPISQIDDDYKALLNER